MTYGEGGGRSHGGFGGGGRSHGGDFGGRKSFAPVNIGDEVDVRIEAVGEKGDGVAKVKGFVLFVPGVKEGEECRIKITRVLKKVGFADKIGEAQGPIEEDQPPAKKAREPEVEPEEVEVEPAEEDSENFGDEPTEEEDPVDEPAEEEDPVDEPAEEDLEEEKKE